MDYEKITIFNRSFWDLWIQKIFRNIASVKYQFMVAFLVIVVAGMFYVQIDGEPLISATLGLSFLGGGFISLASARIYIRTKLREDVSEEPDESLMRKFDGKQELDTDR